MDTEGYRKWIRKRKLTHTWLFNYTVNDMTRYMHSSYQPSLTFQVTPTKTFIAIMLHCIIFYRGGWIFVVTDHQ